MVVLQWMLLILVLAVIVGLVVGLGWLICKISQTTLGQTVAWTVLIVVVIVAIGPVFHLARFATNATNRALFEVESSDETDKLAAAGSVPAKQLLQQHTATQADTMNLESAHLAARQQELRNEAQEVLSRMSFHEVRQLVSSDSGYRIGLDQIQLLADGTAVIPEGLTLEAITTLQSGMAIRYYAAFGAIELPGELEKYVLASQAPHKEADLMLVRVSSVSTEDHLPLGIWLHLEDTEPAMINPRRVILGAGDESPLYPVLRGPALTVDHHAGEQLLWRTTRDRVWKSMKTWGQQELDAPVSVQFKLEPGAASVQEVVVYQQQIINTETEVIS